MLFGLGGWVPTGKGWIEKWNTDFEWHRISDVSRDIRSMAEDWKVNLQSGLSDWEVILCGPRDETGTCGWLDEPNFDFIVEYSLDYVLICKFSRGHQASVPYLGTIQNRTIVVGGNYEAVIGFYPGYTPISRGETLRNHKSFLNFYNFQLYSHSEH